ncbi:serine/threonine protein kinase [Promicromonospora sp. AC04]|uniref:serine/threonine-protein kinase n=1 Tax=Promicromonospora sp. AC04 TaxID=2135723 RepID=UPI000D4F3333|nr:serine/threonine-protein kinase [Promicromonospora sp. AC04]PUB22292.1 serine/threonine protein kinase [Promicromonospora sp. AC04]
MHTGQIVGGRYRLEDRLGSGGHGEVWRAADLKLHERPVALKRTRYDGDDSGADRVRREAETLSRINHPHVVAVSDVVDDGGEVWVVMEYVAGRPLSEIGRVSVEEAARYGAQLAGGLEAVHAHRVLHRDVKPANILVTDDGFAKLADFGISRPLHNDETVTATGALTGTPGYLAPEVAKGGRFTEAADVWSLGATLYHTLEGTTPFGDDNAHALLWKTVSEEVRPPTRAGGMAPVMLRMLAKKPGERPRLREARQELAILAGDPTAGVGPEPSGVPRRPRWVLAAVGAAVVLVAAISTAVWIALDRGDTPGVEASTGSIDGAANAPAPSVAGESDGIIGDPVTADPCALLDVEALGAFGLTRVRTDHAELNRCDVVVTSNDSAVTAVSAKIWHNNEDPAEPNRRVGGITVVDEEDDMPEECSRALFLPGGDYNISLDAEVEAGEVDDLCALADATVNQATTVLNDGQLPRRERTPDPASLYTQSACDLLAGEPLERLPGVVADRPTVGFAEWECKWGTDDGKELTARFQFNDPLSEDSGERFVLSGHEVFNEGDSWTATSCLVSIVNRVAVSADGDGDIVAELVRLHLEADGDESVDELCDVLLDIAQPVAARLPAVS